MPLVFSQDNENRISQLLEEMPHPRSCVLPVLAIAQEQFGYLGHEVMELVAHRLGQPAESIMSTATFYALLNRKPVGKYHVQVCRSLSCSLRGGDGVLGALERELGISTGETTEDGLVTLSSVECLAACGTAPTIRVNDAYFESMDEEQVVALARRLKGDRR